jgi:hypothetical protein
MLAPRSSQSGPERKGHGDEYIAKVTGVSRAQVTRLSRVRPCPLRAAVEHNLRKHRRYRERRMVFTKRRPTPVSIGDRRRPEPEGRPGYLRGDTVHQGDLEGVKGSIVSMP